MSTSFQTPAVEPLSFRAKQDARLRHEREYEVTVNVLNLPTAHVAVQATATEVHVFATDMNVLGAWLYEMNGTITKVDLASGITVWTLRTQTLADSVVAGEVACPVLVTVSQLSDTPVMHEIAAAVRA
ncbi:hypothetical protein ACWCQW_02820 [Streptomyces mirabilis]